MNGIDELAAIPWDLYREILRTMPIACVDVVIVMAGKALLVLRSDEPAKGQFWTPGGRVLKGERLREAAIRKARDETGLDCRVGPIVHTAETIFADGPDGIPVHSINNCFLMYPKAPDAVVSLDAHHQGWRWVATIETDLHPYVRSCLHGAGFDTAETVPER